MYQMMLSSLRRAVAAVTLAALSGCSSHSGNGEIRIELHAAAGTPARYRLVLATANSSPRAVSCPAGGDSKLRCTPSGLLVDALQTGSILTLKAPGYAFVSLTATEDQIARGQIEIALSPLSEFESTSDYRTGMAREGGAAAFAELAVETRTELGPAQSVKFYVSGFDQTPNVYFQNTRLYPLHYDFA